MCGYQLIFQYTQNSFRQVTKEEIFTHWNSVDYLSLSATARYDGLCTIESNLLFMLGRSRGNKMKCPNTLWGILETGFGYPRKDNQSRLEISCC